MRGWAIFVGSWPLFWSATVGADAVAVKAPLVCSRGSGGRTMDAVLHAPKSATSGSTITIRIDSQSSGKISHFGLHYIYDMATDYRLPAGLTFVEGSARVIPGTGTDNVRPTARIWRDTSGIHTLLSARVENGSSYTPPSFEFQVRVDARPGSQLAFDFVRYHVMANAFLVGNVRTTCTPGPRPYPMTTLVVTELP